MRNTMILLLSLMMIASCKTRQVDKRTIESKETSEVVSERNEQKNEQKTEQKTEIKKTEVSQTQKKQEIDIEIKGKAETNRPLEIHNIKNGDTLETFKVVGNADVTYKSREKSDSKIEKESSKQSLESKLQDLANNNVNTAELKHKAEEFRDAAKNVKSTGVPAGVYIVFVIVAIVAIFTFFVYKYFNKS